MKKTIIRRGFSLLLALVLILSLLPGITLEASAAAPGSAEEVVYVKDGKYVYNWGKRGRNGETTYATFLTTYAESYYTGSYTYAYLSGLKGDSGTGTAFYNSELGKAIHGMLVSKQTSTTSYDSLKTLFKYTECEESSTTKISSYYSGTAMGNTWGSGWNREHTWPNSKGLDGADENDVMMIKPTLESENSDRGNTAYGKSSGYYDPNAESSGALDLRGDTARLMLQHLMRWGNTSHFYGTGGVMESRAVLLEWMTADPVDTWEMGRNDAIQQITGIRNVFVDYPELAYLLLGAAVPQDYVTPSGGSTETYTVTAVSNDTSLGTVSVNGYTILAAPAEGCYVKDCEVLTGTASFTVEGNKITVAPSSDCKIRVNFAEKTFVTVTYFANGAFYTDETVYAGTLLTLPTTAPEAEGYSFGGWVTAEIPTEVTEEPKTLTELTPVEDTLLYALYFRSETAEGGSDTYTRTAVSEISSEEEVVIAELKEGTWYGMTNDKGSENPPVPVSFSVNGDEITSAVAENLCWNINYKADGTFTVHPAGEEDGTVLLYCKNANNGVRVGGSSVNNGNTTFKVDSATGYLYNVGTGRYLGIYLTQDWRCYNPLHDNIKNQTLGFFAKGPGTVIYYTTLAGAPVPPGPDEECEHEFEDHVCVKCGEVDFGFAYHSCSFNNDLSINYYVSYSDYVEFDGDITVSFAEEGSEPAAAAEPRIAEVNGEDYLVYTYSGIDSTEMGKEITASYTVHYRGEELTATDVYSVAKYAYSRLDKTEDPEMAALCVNLLLYGAAAQRYFDADAENLVDAALTPEQRALACGADPASVSGTAVYAEQNVRVARATLCLDNTVDLKFYLEAGEDTDWSSLSFTAVYDNIYGERIIRTYTADDLGEGTDGKYLPVQGIAAANMRAPVTLNLTENGIRTAAYTYSVESYCAFAETQEGEQELKDLCRALMGYCVAAETYFS